MFLANKYSINYFIRNSLKNYVHKLKELQINIQNELNSMNLKRNINITKNYKSLQIPEYSCTTYSRTIKEHSKIIYIYIYSMHIFKFGVTKKKLKKIFRKCLYFIQLYFFIQNNVQLYSVLHKTVCRSCITEPPVTNILLKRNITINNTTIKHYFWNKICRYWTGTKLTPTSSCKYSQR